MRGVIEDEDFKTRSKAGKAGWKNRTKGMTDAQISKMMSRQGSSRWKNKTSGKKK